MPLKEGLKGGFKKIVDTIKSPFEGKIDENFIQPALLDTEGRVKEMSENLPKKSSIRTAWFLGDRNIRVFILCGDSAARGKTMALEGKRITKAVAAEAINRIAAEKGILSINVKAEDFNIEHT